MYDSSVDPEYESPKYFEVPTLAIEYLPDEPVMPPIPLTKKVYKFSFVIMNNT